MKAWPTRTQIDLVFDRPKAMNQILPAGPTIKHLEKESKRKLRSRPTQKLSFNQAFGASGVPMLFVLVVCVMWTVWLIFVGLAPNLAANFLMDTGAYDKGQFWLIDDPNPTMTWVGTVGLIVVALCYTFVILRMLLWREKLISSSFQAQERTLLKSSPWLRVVGPSYKWWRLWWDGITSFEGENRKRWNAVLKVVDLGLETVMLQQLLQNGSPDALVYGFAAFQAVNSLSCVANVLTDRFSALTEVLIDSIFDWSCAVLYPIATLLYCYQNFDFDRDVYMTYLEKLPPGSFEHLARVFADPSEIALFRVSFDSLRINSLIDFVVRIGMNLTFCYRVERVLEVLVLLRHREYESSGVVKLVRVQKPSSHQKPVPKALTAVFVLFSLTIIVFSHKAISDSTQLCSVHPECVVFVYRWKSRDEHCPCLALIDINTAPKNYDEWMYPIDATNTVKALASSGMLVSLQVTNRQLVEWPEELRKCQNLKSIQLTYTGTQHIPAWTKEFKSLEILQIEGKYGDPNLSNFPDDLFSNLPRLTMLQFGVHERVTQFPPFSGIPQLQTFIIAWMPQLRSLPTFENVSNLRRLVLTLIPRLKEMPDMAPLRNLVEFVIYRPSNMCCNGFIGQCDLKHSSCVANPFLLTPAATCLTNETNPSEAVAPFHGRTATQRVFDKFSTTICQESPFDRLDYPTFPTKESIDVCGGRIFRQCQYSANRTGICYNARFQALSCYPDANYIALRRLQIQRGVGPKCDPVEEKWLGCGE